MSFGHEEILIAPSVLGVICEGEESFDMLTKV